MNHPFDVWDEPLGVSYYPPLAPLFRGFNPSPDCVRRPPDIETERHGAESIAPGFALQGRVLRAEISYKPKAPMESF